MTHRQIRSLQTELGTRGRLQQLEQWNADVLALSAPAANQFIDNEVTLARFDTRVPQVGDAMPVRMASAETAAPMIRPEAPVRLASADLPAGRLVPAASLVHRASLTAIDPAHPPAAVPRPAIAAAAPIRVSAAPATRRAATPAAARASAATPPPRTPAPPSRAAARRSTALLDESTLSAIGREARAERRGGARD
jgi:hypothetical protein